MRKLNFIIPARSGSKRIPGKNIKNFCGKPMIARAIETALSVENVNKVFVSTDSQCIADIATNNGAFVPVLRDEKLADDHTTTKTVVADFVRILLNRRMIHPSDLIVCLYPCSPFVTKEHIQSAKNYLEHNSIDLVFPVEKYKHPIQRAFELRRGAIKFREAESELQRTQDLREYFHDAGQFYLGTIKSWLSSRNLHSSAHGIYFENAYFIDIDNTIDWDIAEKLCQSQRC